MNGKPMETEKVKNGFITNILGPKCAFLPFLTVYRYTGMNGIPLETPVTILFVKFFRCKKNHFVTSGKKIEMGLSIFYVSP